MHLIQSTLQVSTDGVVDQLRESGKSEEFCQDMRSAMRLSLMYHDLGKIVDISTPDVHETLGKRLWDRMMKPEWVNDRTDELAKWMIDTHDLYGRMARGMTEKEGVSLDSPDFQPDAASAYKGALSPDQVRKKIGEVNRHLEGDDQLSLEDGAAVVKEVWKGDVSSVASLRWLLPVADKLEQVVTHEHTAARTILPVPLEAIPHEQLYFIDE